MGGVVAKAVNAVRGGAEEEPDDDDDEQEQPPSLKKGMFKSMKDGAAMAVKSATHAASAVSGEGLAVAGAGLTRLPFENECVFSFRKT